MKQRASFRRARGLLVASISAVALLALLLLVYDAREVLPEVRAYERSTVILDREGGVLNVSLSADDEWCIPVSLDRMGAWTAAVAVQLEDKRFYEHRGVDFVAICRSLLYNARARKIVSGASTITTQLIRIADPQPRTYRAKLSEFWRAARLEGEMSKAEILELYLNRAPFGGNVRGIEAASRVYFGKSADLLSLAESTLLISILRAPSRFRPDRHPAEAEELRDRSLALLRERGAISEEALQRARDERPPGRRYPLPRHAAMTSAHVESGVEEKVVRSTISVPMQLALEKNIEKALALHPLQITAAAIVVRNGTGEVLAYVGNGRLGSGLPGSEVDCGASPRSPGSTLKPFFYAAAFERGLLTPGSLLADTPLAFRGGAPRNFDLSYRGAVSARAALSSSLNAPAVRVLRRLGYGEALEVLRRFGFSHIDRDGAYYADSLVLGGCEVTLQELAAAYRSLAQLGASTPLAWRLESAAPERPEKFSISPEASYLTLDILLDTGRLLPLYRDVFAEENRRIAFKTGTSHGLRDSWCVGVTDAYTVAVWLGIPEGKGADALVGLQSAAPIVMQIFRGLTGPEGDVFARPGGIYERSACATSGLLPSKNCPHRIRELAIGGVSSVELCRMHRIVDGKIVTIWPPELSNWMRAAIKEPSIGQPVKITKPFHRTRYRLEKEKTNITIRFSAEGPLPHHWYLDGIFLGVDRNGEGFFADVSAGTHVVSILSGGETDRVSFEVAKFDARKKDTRSPGVLD